MEQWILWALVAVGVGLLLLGFLILPARDVWVSFLLNAYAASFFGSIVAGAGLLEYPVRFFASYTMPPRAGRAGRVWRRNARGMRRC
ncbi:hypothetical protein P9851_14420 [Geobacillus stearothermophilus]|uniref:hypothetical protein n=1 Tax=Geobacillus stearothermophilus TaxID=1422 RepID=UPI002E1B758A|nr:hypothetical protein [Geobacillus stearothermophilus]